MIEFFGVPINIITLNYRANPITNIARIQLNNKGINKLKGTKYKKKSEAYKLWSTEKKIEEPLNSSTNQKCQ